MTDQLPKPKWVEKFERLFDAGIAHSFNLHFNVKDYVLPEIPISLPIYLSKLMANRDVVAIYSRDKGIEFPTETMRQKAMEILGMDEAGPEATDPALAALQQLGVAGPTDSEQTLPSAPEQALPLLDKLLRSSKVIEEDGQEFQVGNTAVIIEGAELIIPDAPIAQLSPADRQALATVTRWGRDNELMRLGNPVFILTSSLAGIHNELRAASNRFESIEVPLPNQKDRLDFITRYTSQNSGIEFADGLTPEIVANATAGLSLMGVEDILLRAVREGQLTQVLVWERKQDIIRSEFGDVLEVINPTFTFNEIGGLQYVKDFFIRSIIRPIHENRRGRVPMGVLMTGPAGTGKSIMAVAVAAEAGINAVILRIGGQIASKWQGEGERNLARALQAVEALAPTIVFIDEIDQAVSRGGDGAGNQQDSRIFQRLLEFMSDTKHRGEVVFLAATNRPDRMDAALRRPGRFDKKIPFLVAEEDDERQAIFRVMSRRYLGVECEADAETLKATAGQTGAEIEAITVKALELVEDEGLEPCEALGQAAKRLRPSTADIELMTMLAIRETNDLDLLPPKYRSMKEESAEMEAKIEAIQAKETEPSFRRQRRL